jgi:hypothetical protein
MPRSSLIALASQILPRSASNGGLKSTYWRMLPKPVLPNLSRDAKSSIITLLDGLGEHQDSLKSSRGATKARQQKRFRTGLKRPVG